MKLKYKIVEVHPAEHSIVVRYYTDKITELELATDVLEGVVRRGRTDFNLTLPVPAPAGTELETFILRHAPAEWLAVKEAVADPAVDTTLTALTALVGVEHDTAQPLATEVEFPVHTGEV